MASELFVDNITGKTGTSGGAPITLSGDTATLGTGTTLGSGADIKAAINASGTAPIYACRAWVNFNGTGTVSIRGSGNVTDITDEGTGLFTVNFTTAMENINYSVFVESSEGGSGGPIPSDRQGTTARGNDSFKTTSVSISVRDNASATNRDNEYNFVAVIA